VLQDVATVKATAAQAVSEFIRSPDLFQFDLFESPTITQLKGDSEYGHLYQLLDIILNGNLSVSSPTWAARYFTWLLIKSRPKGVVCSVLF